MRCDIRRLTEGDVAEVASLEAAARASAVDMRGGAVLVGAHPAVTHWEQHLHAGSTPVWVAVIDDLVAGFLALEIDGGVARVRQVFVHPDARELGLGEWLLDAAIDHASGVGCTAIEALALPGDRETKNLYERAGITARLLVLRRSLP